MKTALSKLLFTSVFAFGTVVAADTAGDTTAQKKGVVTQLTVGEWMPGQLWAYLLQMDLNTGLLVQRQYLLDAGMDLEAFSRDPEPLTRLKKRKGTLWSEEDKGVKVVSRYGWNESPLSAHALRRVLIQGVKQGGFLDDLKKAINRQNAAFIQGGNQAGVQRMQKLLAKVWGTQDGKAAMLTLPGYRLLPDVSQDLSSMLSIDVGKTGTIDLVVERRKGMVTGFSRILSTGAGMPDEATLREEINEEYERRLDEKGKGRAF